jgi:heme/copper-type cytochrome/quinol oxidase subunit 2
VQSRKEYSVSARKYSYRVEGADRPEIRVREGDLVHITFSSEDIPHSFTLVEDGDQHYRLMKRAEVGKPVTFDFVADKPGTYQFQCTLRLDDRCKELVGTLIVEAKK